MRLAVREEDRVCWWAVLTWVGILIYVLAVWGGLAYGIYVWKFDAGAPKVSCSKPVLVELDNGAISTIHCNTPAR